MGATRYSRRPRCVAQSTCFVCPRCFRPGSGATVGVNLDGAWGVQVINQHELVCACKSATHLIEARRWAGECAGDARISGVKQQPKTSLLGLTGSYIDPIFCID